MANWGTSSSKLKAVYGGEGTNNADTLFAIGHSVYNPLTYKTNFEYKGDPIRFPNPANNDGIQFYILNSMFAKWIGNRYVFPSILHRPYIVGQRTYENDENVYYDGFLLLTNNTDHPVTTADFLYVMTATFLKSDTGWDTIEGTVVLTDFYTFTEQAGWRSRGPMIDTDHTVGCVYTYGGINSTDYSGQHVALIYSGRRSNEAFIDAARLWQKTDFDFVSYTKCYRLVNSIPELIVYEDTTEEKVVTSEDDKGDGTYDNDSDEVDFPALPSVTAADCGFLTMYKPTLSELRSFSGYLWSTDFIDNLEKIWTDPMELIISLSILPVNLEAGSYEHIKLAGMDSGVDARKLNNQYVAYNCGKLKVKEYFGGSLDYNPFTKVSIYIPYIGICTIDTDEVMDGELELQYNIDILSGAFIVCLKVTRPNLKSVLHHWQGNMATQIPITSSNASRIYSSILSIASSAVTGVVSGAAAGPAGAIAGGIGGAVTTGASESLTKKTSIQKSNTNSGPAGYSDDMKPYLIIERPIQSLASNYNQFVGYPSNITSVLSSLKGYTQIETVLANGLKCPQAEQNEIIELLKSGVII